MAHLIYCILTSALLTVTVSWQSAAPQDPPTGRRGRLGLPASDASLCGKCHEEISREPTEDEEFVHEPVGKGDCSSCHNPHASHHGGLLTTGSSALCLPCHEDYRGAGDEPFAHTPVRDGQCVECHEPHRGDIPGGVRMEGLGLCVSCHPEVGRLTEDGDTYLHAPFEYGQCLLCHDPHVGSGPGAVRLVGAQACAGCHDLTTPEIAESHAGGDLQSMDCLSCHNPHGSTAEHGVRPVQHEPFQQGACEDCHLLEEDDPLGLFVEGGPLCLMCHSDYANLDDKRSVHQPVTEGQCLECHASHASDETGLLRGTENAVCTSCHAEVVQRSRASHSSHLDYDQGRCSSCHQAHASDQLGLMKADGIQACAECHDTHASFTHPMGENAQDPRTGLPIDCLTCHDPHGTDHAFFLTDDPGRDLCIQCHDTF